MRLMRAHLRALDVGTALLPSSPHPCTCHVSALLAPSDPTSTPQHGNLLRT